eukprot:11531329-Prorocentrum_lima.AAC.1
MSGASDAQPPARRARTDDAMHTDENPVITIDAVVKQFDTLKTMLLALQQVSKDTLQATESLQSTITKEIKPDI